MTIAIPAPQIKKHSLTPYIIALALAVFAAALVYIALSGDAGNVTSSGTNTTVEPVFTDEWFAAQTEIGSQSSTEPVFTEEWLASQASVGSTSAERVFTDEWLAAQAG